MKILVSNAGSTSLKFKLFDMPEETALCDARVERVGSRDAAIFTYVNLITGEKKRMDGLCVAEYTDGIDLFLQELTREGTGVLGDIGEVEAVGFKTVIAHEHLGDHELTDEEIQTIYQIGTCSGLKEEKISDFFLWAAKGIEWQIEGTQLVEDNL